MRSKKRRLRQNLFSSETTEFDSISDMMKYKKMEKEMQAHQAKLEKQNDDLEAELKKKDAELKKTRGELDKLRDEVKKTNMRPSFADVRKSISKKVGLRDELDELYELIKKKYPNFNEKTDDIPKDFKDIYNEAWNRRSKRIRNSYRYRTGRALGLYQRKRRR